MGLLWTLQTPEATPTPTATPTPNPSATPTPTPSPTPGIAGNVSTRLPVGRGDNALIEGFIVQGPAGSTKKIVVRAIGPVLKDYGIADALENPTLQVFDEKQNLVASNNDWQTAQIGGLITSNQTEELLSSKLAPTKDLESAVIVSLPPGLYTAVVRGADDSVGTAVVDAYDVSTSSPARLANIATRGLIQAGDNLMIAGFIVQNGNATVAIRAIGPSSKPYGIPNFLQDTTLQLRDKNGAIVRENDNWKTDQQQELEKAVYAPSEDLEAALITTIPAGAYTAQVRGKNDAVESGLCRFTSSNRHSLRFVLAGRSCPGDRSVDRGSVRTLEWDSALMSLIDSLFGRPVHISPL